MTDHARRDPQDNWVLWWGFVVVVVVCVVVGLVLGATLSWPEWAIGFVSAFVGGLAGAVFLRLRRGPRETRDSDG